MSEYQCNSCQTCHSGRFCPSCGEERLSPELRTAGFYVSELFKEVTSLDGKFWGTLRTLITQPGVLERDYANGRRQIYIKPITLFLLVNVFYVMFASLSDFYVNFYSQRDLQIYSPLIQSYLDSFVAASGYTNQEFINRYDQLVKALARSLIIIQVPFFAFFMAILCHKKELFSGDYLIFSLNYHSWILLVFIFCGYPDHAIQWINESKILPFDIPYIQFVLLIIGKFLYAILAIKTMFGYTWLQVVWRLPFVILIYYISHISYRFIQLLITVSMIE